MARQRGKQPIIGGVETGILIAVPGILLFAYLLSRPSKKKKTTSTAPAGSLPPPAP